MRGHVVDLWWSDLRAMDLRLLPLLDAAESERAGAIVGAADLGRFVVGAVLLRVAVASATGVAPAEVVVERTCDECGAPHGRPRVAGVHASVAHAGPLVVVATCADPVGVDVESLERGDDVAGWVRDEAVLKATGSRDGLADVVDVAPAFAGYLAAVAALGPVELVTHGQAESAAAIAALPTERGGGPGDRGRRSRGGA